MPRPLADDVRRDLDARFSTAEQAELAMGIGLFLGMSKVLITLGVEPENMPTTVISTPGSRAGP